VIARLGHTYSDVRASAVQALLEISHDGDMRAIAALESRKCEANMAVKKAVTDGLKQLQAITNAR